MAEDEKKNPEETAVPAAPKKKKGWIIPVVILGVLLILVGGAYGIFRYFYGLTNYVKDSGSISYASDVEDETLDPAMESSILAEIEERSREAASREEASRQAEGSSKENPTETVTASETEETEQPTGSVSSEDSEDSTEDPSETESDTETDTETETGTDTESDTETDTEPRATVIPTEGNPEGVYNLLLIGVDAHSDSWYGNSDSMIMVTVNYNTKKVWLTSFMRDTGVTVPGVGFRKLNASYANGGAPLLIETLKTNFGVFTDNYAMVGFEALKEVINAVGGIDLYLTQEETDWLRAKDPPEDVGPGDRVVHLNGRAALWHARNRSSGGYDYGRTQRQRDVLMALVKKAKKSSVPTLINLAKTILPMITHNMDTGTILKLLGDLPTILKFEFNQMRVPYDGTFRSENEFLIPDYELTTRMYYDGILN